MVRNLLGCFLFRGDDVHKRVGVLSGGERSRVALVCMLLHPANFLILDEPTNHLDIQSQQVLQQALSEYPGSYCIVSHNRSFLDPIVTKVLEFVPGEKPRVYLGNVSDYLEKVERDQALAASSPSSGAAEPGAGLDRKARRRMEAEIRQKKTRLLRPLQEKLELLEEEIACLETEKRKLLLSWNVRKWRLIRRPSWSLPPVSSRRTGSWKPVLRNGQIFRKRLKRRKPAFKKRRKEAFPEAERIFVYFFIACLISTFHTTVAVLLSWLQCVFVLQVEEVERVES